MAESIEILASSDRSSIYEQIAPQIESLIGGETDATANLANAAAVLREAFGFFWVGFYLVKEGELVLGPFQGPVACTRIAFDKGVCGHAYTTRETIVVPDVDKFPGHIACSSASRSEIVVPIFGKGESVIGVLDVDSDKLEDFGAADKAGLEKIVRILERFIQGHTNPDPSQ